MMEQFATSDKRHDEVDVRLGLEGVAQANEERMVDLGHNIALSLEIRDRVVFDDVLVAHDLPRMGSRSVARTAAAHSNYIATFMARISSDGLWRT